MLGVKKKKSPQIPSEQTKFCNPQAVFQPAEYEQSQG